jgi:hypothetical protein
MVAWIQKSWDPYYFKTSILSKRNTCPNGGKHHHWGRYILLNFIIKYEIQKYLLCLQTDKLISTQNKTTYNYVKKKKKGLADALDT